jgi:hypothetical protein
VQSDRDNQPQRQVVGPELGGGAPVVQPELARVPGLLERRVSAAERKAFEPEVKALLKALENNWKENANA